MARRMPPWAWSILAREFGPKHAPTRLVLFALRTWMDSVGENCFPSMPTIAKATQLSLRSINKAVDRARRETWIAVYKVPGEAGANPHNYYVACIPEWVDLDVFDSRRSAVGDRTFAALSDSWASQWGDVEDDLHGKPRPKPRPRVTPSAPDDKRLVHEVHPPSAPHDKHLVHVVHSKSPSKSPSKYPKSKVARARLTGFKTMEDEDPEPKPGARTMPSDSSTQPEVLQGIGSRRRKPDPSKGFAIIELELAKGIDLTDAWDTARRCGYDISQRDVASWFQQRGAA